MYLYGIMFTYDVITKLPFLTPPPPSPLDHQSSSEWGADIGHTDICHTGAPWLG